MEAEVLNPQMMADVNGNNKIADAELEVKKLQELVRKLERQNEQLRTRANVVNNCNNGPHLQTSLSCGSASCPVPGSDFTGNCCVSSHPCVLAPYGEAEEPFAYFHPNSPGDSEERSAGLTVLDEVDVLDLDTVLPVVESDSWLYVSSKARLWGQQALSPLQWCRLVLDHPGPEVELAKRTICHRLDQAKRWRGVSSLSVRPYSCIEGLSSLSGPASCPILPYTKPATLTQPTAPFSPSSHPLLQQTLPGRGNSSLADRAPTFLSHSTLHSAGRRHAAVSPQSSLDSEVGVSDLEDDSISMGYKLQDMTDVQVMARLQEESLRQEYASTSATISRRSSSFSLHGLRRGEMDLEEEDEEEEDDDEGYDQLPPPQPRLFRAGSGQRGGLPHSHTFSSIRDCRRSPSAPQYSLSGLAQFQNQASGPPSPGTETHTGYRHSNDKLRRSMPNLIRAPSMPCVPSAPSLASPVSHSHGPASLPMTSSLRNSQSFDSSNGLARLQSSIPSPGQLTQRFQSVGNFPSSSTQRHPLKATAYVSPTVQQGPHPSSSSNPSTPLSSSVSLHSIPCSVALPQPLKAGPAQAAAPRSGLPRPASFSGGPRPSKIAQPARSLLTPPKSLAALSALRDGSWKEGCY